MIETTLLSQLLDRVHRCVAEQRTPVVVFDLDHTLFDNAPRTWQILTEFAERCGHAALRQSLDRLPHLGLPYLLGETLSRCGIHDETIHRDAFVFWRERFFTDAYQRYDVPLTGSVRFVQQLYAAGAQVTYLSGRDAPGMLVGCTEALRQHGFPVGLVRTCIVLKHDFDTPDLDFKADAVDYINTQGLVIASFDNEPGNCNLFQESWPSAANVYVRTAHAPNPPKLIDGIISISDFSTSSI